MPFISFWTGSWTSCSMGSRQKSQRTKVRIWESIYGSSGFKVPNAEVQGGALGVAEARSGGGVPCNAQLGPAADDRLCDHMEKFLRIVCAALATMFLCLALVFGGIRASIKEQRGLISAFPHCI